MAFFKPAYLLGRTQEGGYNHIKGDRGGRTYLGIAENDNPKWVGWAKIDAWIAIHGEPAYNHVFTDIEGLDDDVESFYETTYWIPIRGAEINDQDTANDIYCHCRNEGIHEGIILVQRSFGIPENGQMDDLTIQSLNNSNITT